MTDDRWAGERTTWAVQVAQIKLGWLCALGPALRRAARWSKTASLDARQCEFWVVVGTAGAAVLACRPDRERESAKQCRWTGRTSGVSVGLQPAM